MIWSIEVRVRNLHDLVSGAEALLLSRAALLDASDEDPHIIPSCQPQPHTVSFLEAHHHCVSPAGGGREGEQETNGPLIGYYNIKEYPI